MATYGRGGAGNIKNAPSPKVEPVDLQTPTLKSSHYTTGRGGSGNMAVNDPLNPAEARAAQDVETPAHHAKEMQGTYHWGRGGEGNMTTVGKSERQQSKERKPSIGQIEQKRDRALSKEKLPERRGSFQRTISRGKEMLGLKNNAARNEATLVEDESAIE